MKMPATLRFTEAEKDLLRKKSVEINKLLIKDGKEPLKDSQLAHRVLELGLARAHVNKNGEIYFED